MRIRQSLLALILMMWFSLQTVFAQEKDSTYFKKENAAGVQKIQIDGKFWVWTQKIGDGKIPVLLLHGGPAQSHEYFEIFSRYLPSQGITIYYYDQFGSYFSQTPTPAQLKDTSIWKVHRYVDEIEQVRKALHLDKFFIYGHSYGALLALAYTYKYQSHVKGLIFSDMNPYQSDFGNDINAASVKTDSIMSKDGAFKRLMQEKASGVRYDTAAYRIGFDSTFTRNFVIRLDTLPGEMVRTKKHKNFQVAALIGPSTFSLDYAAMIRYITVPVLLMAGEYDFIITPSQLEKLGKKFTLASWCVVPKGGHICFADDASDYFPCLIAFIKKNER